MSKDWVIKTTLQRAKKAAENIHKLSCYRQPLRRGKDPLSYFSLLQGFLCFPMLVPGRQISPAVSWIFTKFDYLSFPATDVMMSPTLLSFIPFLLEFDI